jgi:predicted RNase H-like HicB family nuclease
MKHPADLYQKIIVWSKEDNCFVGTCPELFHGGVHGDDALDVFKELSEVVDEWVEIFNKDGKPLPTPKGVEVLETA